MGKSHRRLLDAIYPVSSKKISGFTLIEIIIVIALLGVLTLIAISFQSKTIERGRNSRRISDLEQLRNVLEMYRADNSSKGYPNALDSTDFKGVYIKTDPKDPQGYTYSYKKGGNNYSYCLCAPMEQTQDLPQSQCTDMNANWLPAGYIPYCVSSN